MLYFLSARCYLTFSCIFCMHFSLSFLLEKKINFFLLRHVERQLLNSSMHNVWTSPIASTYCKEKLFCINWLLNFVEANKFMFKNWIYQKTNNLKISQWAYARKSSSSLSIYDQKREDYNVRKTTFIKNPYLIIIDSFFVSEKY